MGLTSSNPFNYLFAKKEARITIAGLNGVGATTILYWIKLGKVVPTTITVGFNLEKIDYRNITFIFWDIGAWNKSYLLWKHYLHDTRGLIYVVDSSDNDKINKAREQLMSLLNTEQLCNGILLIFANKQDLPDAMSISELTEKLGLNDGKTRCWHIQPTSAISGEGIYEGLDWLCNQLND